MLKCFNQKTFCKIFLIVFSQHIVEVREPAKNSCIKIWQRGAVQPPLLLYIEKMRAGGS